MAPYQNFEKEGAQYILKPQTGFTLSIVSLLVALGILTIMYGPVHNLGYLLIGIAGLAWYSHSKRKMVIDKNRRLFVAKNNGFQPEVTYPFNAYTGVTMHKITYFGFLTINVSAVMNFIVDGTEKNIGLHQSLSSGSVQKLINELNEILEECEVISKHGEDNNTPSF